MIRVLIVDDSAIVRQVFSREFSKAADIEVVGTAADPYIARDMIVKLNPDVITLDVEMPRMDGLTFLQIIMKHNPIPTIIVSSLTQKGGEMAMEALDIGAIDVVCKPGTAYSVGDISSILIDQIRAAAKTDFSIMQLNKNSLKNTKVIKHSITKTTDKIIAIGASTGGTVALEKVLRQMPVTSPGIVVVQHMPEKFTASFADRLNNVCDMEIREAKDNDVIIPGRVLIAPGNFHMIVTRSGARYIVKLKTSAPVFHQRPSVEVMFNSVAKYVGANAVGVILTGMGKDGAQGLLNIKNAGAKTVAQDEKTSVVWGMPGEAVKIGAADFVLPLDKIAQKTLNLASS